MPASTSRPSVLDLGEDDAGLFFAMEYVEGLSVFEMLALGAEAGPLPLPLCLTIAAQAAMFGAQRAERAATTAQALERALSAPPPARSPRTPRRLARWGLVATAALVAGGVAYRALAVRHGLRGEYFGDVEMRTTKFSRIDPEIAFDWGTASPDPRVAPENFTVRWTGHITAPAAGPTSLCLVRDDGSRLWFDGRLVIDKWRTQWPTQVCGEVVFAAKTRHQLQIDYLEVTGLAYVRLFWTMVPSADYAEVPSQHLFPPEPGDPPPQAPPSLEIGPMPTVSP